MRKIAIDKFFFPNLRSKKAKQKSEAKNALKSKFNPILIDFSLCFFANHFFKSTATCLILVKNLGNFTNKNAKNISEILVKMEMNLILIDFSLVYFANLFFKMATKTKRKINQNWILIDFPLRFPLLKCR